MIESTFTPPENLIDKWVDECLDDENTLYIACAHAAQWGADRELDACCRWLHDEMLAPTEWSTGLRAARRPQLNLKESALSELNLTADSDGVELSRAQVELIRHALESLPD